MKPELTQEEIVAKSAALAKVIGTYLERENGAIAGMAILTGAAAITLTAYYGMGLAQPNLTKEEYFEGCGKVFQEAIADFGKAHGEATKAFAESVMATLFKTEGNA